MAEEILASVQVRRDNKANWEAVNPVLLDGEAAYEKDTDMFKIGDGVNSYKNLPYHNKVGPKGDTGATPQISMNVSTGNPGTSASVNVTGTAENPVINLTVPRGDTGETGSAGPKGDTGSSGVYIGTTQPTDSNINVWIDSDGEPTEVIDDLAREEISSLKNDISALNQANAALNDHAEDTAFYTGRQLAVELGAFSTNSFLTGTNNSKRARTEIISGVGGQVEISCDVGFKYNILSLAAGAETATYLSSDNTGKRRFLFDETAQYRILIRRSDESEIDKLPALRMDFSSDNLNMRFDSLEMNCNADAEEYKNIIDVYQFGAERNDLGALSVINGDAGEITFGDSGASASPTSHVILAVNNDRETAFDVYSEDTNTEICALLSADSIRGIAYFCIITASGSVYLAKTKNAFGSLTLTKIKEMSRTKIYSFTFCGNNIFVKNAYGRSALIKIDDYLGENYHGIAFPSGRLTALSALVLRYKKVRSAYDVSMISGKENTKEITFSYASKNEKAIEFVTDTANPYISFNCDKTYGETDVGSNRYRSELALQFDDDVIPVGKIELDYYLPSELNVPDVHDDIIIQLHDSTYTDLDLAPPIALLVNNGKLWLWLNTNRNEPTESGDYTSKRYELCNVEYDKWCHLEFSYTSGYAEFLRPHTLVRVNGTTVADTKEINGMNLSRPCYLRIGLYEREWAWLDPAETNRTIYMRNIRYTH